MNLMKCAGMLLCLVIVLQSACQETETTRKTTATRTKGASGHNGSSDNALNTGEGVLPQSVSPSTSPAMAGPSFASDPTSLQPMESAPSNAPSSIMGPGSGANTQDAGFKQRWQNICAGQEKLTCAGDAPGAQTCTLSTHAINGNLEVDGTKSITMVGKCAAFNGLIESMCKVLKEDGPLGDLHSSPVPLTNKSSVRPTVLVKSGLAGTR